MKDRDIWWTICSRTWVGLTWISEFHYLAQPLLPNSHQPRPEGEFGRQWNPKSESTQHPTELRFANRRSKLRRQNSDIQNPRLIHHITIHHPSESPNISPRSSAATSSGRQTSASPSSKCSPRGRETTRSTSPSPSSSLLWRGGDTR